MWVYWCEIEVMKALPKILITILVIVAGFGGLGVLGVRLYWDSLSRDECQSICGIYRYKFAFGECLCRTESGWEWKKTIERW